LTLQVHARLNEAGISSWVDKEHLDADLNNEMSNGIDRSKLVIVFITQAYIDKVQGYGKRGLDENCKAEFEYALRRRGTRRMLVVVMDPSCFDTSAWTGAVGFRLGSQIYHDLSADDQSEVSIEGLVHTIQDRLKDSSRRTDSTSAQSPGRLMASERTGSMSRIWRRRATFRSSQSPGPVVSSSAEHA
jgi:hypothetical protein